MVILIECEGVLFDISGACYRAFRDAATEVGWSRLDRPTFWRLLRKDGHEANLLPGARPAKLEEFRKRFAERLESDEVLALYELRRDACAALAKLSRRGRHTAVSLGANAAPRRALIAGAGLDHAIPRLESLSPDPRRRPVELRTLATGERRVIVVASTDSLIRSAGAAEMFTVGIADGACLASRLHRAGASIVLAGLDELEASLQQGAVDLIRAGLPPASLD